MIDTITLPRAVLEQALKWAADHGDIVFFAGGFPVLFSMNTWAEALRAALEQPQVEQEPDWSDSKTMPTELWKNRLLSLQERLQIADGAVQWTRKVVENLRSRLYAAQPQGEQEPIGEAHEWGAYEHEYGRYTHCIWDARVVPIGTKLYTSPHPPRHPLTDDDLELMWQSDTTSDEDCRSLYYYKVVAHAVEAAHGIKEQE